MRLLQLAGLGLSLALGGNSLFATITKFENSIDFSNASLTPFVVEDFEFATNTQVFTPGDLNLKAGIAYTGAKTYFDENFFGGGVFPQFTSTQLWNSTLDGSILSLDFSLSATAVSLNLVTWAGDNPTGGAAGNSIDVFTSTGGHQTFLVSTIGNNPGFFGFVSDDGDITQIVLTSALTNVGVDNITLGNAVAVPEPSTYALLAGSAGLAGAAVWRRRRASAASAAAC